MGFSRQKYWSGLPFPSPVDHTLSELSTMTHPSWVVLQIMLKILQVRLQQYMNWELPDVQAGFRKDIEIKCQCLLDHGKSKRVSEKHLVMLCWLLQSLWLCGSQQTVKYSSRDGNTRPPYLSPEESVCGQEATVKTRHGTMDWFQIGNEYVKAVYHSVYLTYMQSTSCKMPD